jgi:hypothetical protein
VTRVRSRGKPRSPECTRSRARAPRSF